MVVDGDEVHMFAVLGCQDCDMMVNGESRVFAKVDGNWRGDGFNLDESE